MPAVTAAIYTRISSTRGAVRLAWNARSKTAGGWPPTAAGGPEAGVRGERRLHPTRCRKTRPIYEQRLRDVAACQSSRLTPRPIASVIRRTDEALRRALSGHMASNPAPPGLDVRVRGVSQRFPRCFRSPRRPRANGMSRQTP
jgi:hypothetical protein